MKTLVLCLVCMSVMGCDLRGPCEVVSSDTVSGTITSARVWAGWYAEGQNWYTAHLSNGMDYTEESGQFFGTHDDFWIGDTLVVLVEQVRYYRTGKVETRKQLVQHLWSEMHKQREAE